MQKQGDAISLLRWKTLALCHVRFNAGKGYKKYVAMENVAKAIGQDVETLRSWEKQLLSDPDREDDLYVAQVAGAHEADLVALADRNATPKQFAKLEDTIVGERYRNMPLSDRVRVKFEELQRNPLENVCAGLLDRGVPKR